MSDTTETRLNALLNSAIINSEPESGGISDYFATFVNATFKPLGSLSTDGFSIPPNTMSLRLRNFDTMLQYFSIGTNSLYAAMGPNTLWSGSGSDPKRVNSNNEHLYVSVAEYISVGSVSDFLSTKIGDVLFKYEYLPTPFRPISTPLVLCQSDVSREDIANGFMVKVECILPTRENMEYLRNLTPFKESNSPDIDVIRAIVFVKIQRLISDIRRGNGEYCATIWYKVCFINSVNDAYVTMNHVIEAAEDALSAKDLLDDIVNSNNN